MCRFMNRLAVIAVLCACLGAWPVADVLRADDKSPEKVSLALQWLTQCQFAGYYAGLDQGFYRREGIDLTIVPGAPDINPLYLVSSEVADFGTKWLADFMVAREQGLDLVSIGQLLQSNGLVLLAKADSGIRTPADFVGKRVGIWFFGNEVQFFALMNQIGVPLDKVQVGPIKWSIQPFLSGEFDVVMAMIYNEYLRVLDSGYREEDIRKIDFADYGLNFPGQVLFTRTSLLKTRPDLCERMLRASLDGWIWAMDHPEETVDIVLKHDETGSLEKGHQLRQMRAVTQLVRYGGRPLGWHAPEQVAFVAQKLTETNVLTRVPDLSGIYTNAVWEKARREEN